MSDVIIAPFSNSYIRDWPLGHYAALVGRLLDRLDEGTTIRVVGTRNQKTRACEVVRAYPTARVVNECGRLAWPEMVERLKRARCVVSNNSGVGHLGGYYGVPTVCVFGGSHYRQEWRPKGASVILVSRVIGCSPCQLDHGGASPYDKACLREIDPQTVADAAFTIMGRVAAARGEGEE